VNSLRVLQEEDEVEDWGVDAADLSGSELGLASDSEEEDPHAGMFPVMSTSGPNAFKTEWLPLALLDEEFDEQEQYEEGKEQYEERAGEWEEGNVDRVEEEKPESA
jgi:hypothetical protein